VRWTLYSFDAGKNESYGGDGSLLFFSDGAQAPPSTVGATGGCLGYLAGKKDCHGPNSEDSLQNAYLGVGFDEFGDFGKFLHDGPGEISDTVDLAGAQPVGYPYLGGVVNGSGQAISLPFPLDYPLVLKRPASGLAMDVTLNPSGLVQVNIDSHDGKGFVTYVSENIVGINHEPGVPASVYVGFTAATGNSILRHQIQDLTISTLQ
jgi:hypothetical protein